jgi:hypothetical protein
MSMNYDFELLRSIDMAAYAIGKKKLRSDDYEILSLYSGDEEAAIEGLKIWTANKGSYFDRRLMEWRPRTDLTIINGHAVVDLTYLHENPAERIRREKYVENKRRSSMRRHFP